MSIKYESRFPVAPVGPAAIPQSKLAVFRRGSFREKTNGNVTNSMSYKWEFRFDFIYI